MSKSDNELWLETQVEIAIEEVRNAIQERWDLIFDQGMDRLISKRDFYKSVIGTAIDGNVIADLADEAGYISKAAEERIRTNLYVGKE